MEMPIRRIAEWIDDWFAGYLRKYIHSDVENRLKELGFSNTERLNFGTHYDTSQMRLGANGCEINQMGEGDLRYFCKKTRDGSGNEYHLPHRSAIEGSSFHDSPEVTQFFPILNNLSENLKWLETKQGREISTSKS